jgi:hypothetical protein
MKFFMVNSKIIFLFDILCMYVCYGKHLSLWHVIEPNFTGCQLH